MRSYLDNLSELVHCEAPPDVNIHDNYQRGEENNLKKSKEEKNVTFQKHIQQQSRCHMVSNHVAA